MNSIIINQTQMLENFKLDIYLPQVTWDEMKEQLDAEATDQEITNLFCKEYKESFIYKWSVAKNGT